MHKPLPASVKITIVRGESTYCITLGYAGARASGVTVTFINTSGISVVYSQKVKIFRVGISVWVF